MKKRAVGWFMICAVLLSASCGRSKLDQAYRDLCLSMDALEFPADQASLDNCVARQVQSCLAVYERAKRGKQVIRSMDQEQTLQHALKTVREKCPPDRISDRRLCEGALASFYFYTDKGADQALLNAIRSLPRGLEAVVFGNVDYAWFGNRPDPAPWLEFVRTLPDNVFTRLTKQQVLDAFSGAGQPRKVGIGLL